MDNLKNVLNEYGLELKRRNEIENQLDFVLDVAEQSGQNSIKLIVKLLEAAFDIKVKDLSRMKEKLELEPKFDALDHLIKTRMDIKLYGYEYTNYTERCVARFRVVQMGGLLELVVSQGLQNEPEKYGVTGKKLKLESLFDPKAYLKYQEKIMLLIRELVIGESSEEKLDLLGRKIVSVIEGLTVEDVYEELGMPIA